MDQGLLLLRVLNPEEKPYSRVRVSKILEPKVRVLESEGESSIDQASCRSLGGNVFSGNRLNKEAEGKTASDQQMFIWSLQDQLHRDV